MKTLSLLDFFSTTGYDWRKDEEVIKTICHYTKTRVDPKAKGIKLCWGFEQTFLVKAVAEWVGAEMLFEIGTGRGTADYAVSLVPSIKEIYTVDLLEFKQKFSTAIGYKQAVVSLKDIRDLIPFEEKRKVMFNTRNNLPALSKKISGKCDLAFIDGDHTNKKTILEDFKYCKEVLKKDGIILWDDYDPDQFAVKEVVDKLLLENPSYDAVLVEQRGHLFTDKPAEKDRGVVIMKFGKLGL